MNIPYSKWQTQRRCSPDQKNIVGRYHWILVKGCSQLRLTYQIQYLAEEAEKRKLSFLITVPKGCRVSPELRQFIKEHRYTTLKRVDHGQPAKNEEFAILEAEQERLLAMFEAKQAGR